MDCEKCGKPVLVNSDRSRYKCYFCNHVWAMTEDEAKQYRLDYDYDIKLNQALNDARDISDIDSGFLQGVSFVESYIQTMLNIIEECDDKIDGDYLKYLKNMVKRIRI